jgi:hypothetical protein
MTVTGDKPLSSGIEEYLARESPIDSPKARRASGLARGARSKKGAVRGRGRRDPLGQYEAIIKDQLFGSMAKLCHSTKRQIESKFGGIRLLSEPDIEGYCISTLDQKGGLINFRVELYSGIFIYPWKIAEMLATRTGFKDPQDRSTIEEPAFSVEKSIELAKRLSDAFWNNRLQELATASAVKLSKRQETFSLLLTVSALRFVLGHEFGHAAMHLKKDSLEEEEWARNNVAKIVEMSDILKNVGNDKRDEIESNWWQEVAADIIGVKLSVESQKDKFQRIMAYAGAEYVLMLLHYLETRAPQMNMLGSDSHPSPMMRAYALRGYYGNNPASLFEFAEMIGTLAKRMFFPEEDGKSPT